MVSGRGGEQPVTRATFEDAAKNMGIAVFFPSRALSADNAAMIVAAAFEDFARGVFADSSLNADPSLVLA
jgi:N6-L-threonylcarbamoyladenine synthase